MLDTSLNISINQKPNDAADAARLYGQLREEAVAEVVSATVSTLGANNEIKFIKIDSHRDPLWMKLKVRLVFSINGKVYDIVTDNTEQSISDTLVQNIMLTVFDQCSKELQKMI